eukprot:1466538-Rhodomonas_salina.1
MAQGNETLPEVKLWCSALILWGEIFEEDPSSFPFEKLKVGVAQGLSRFTEEESTEDQGYAKRPCLNPTLPPAVAFSVEELNNYCAHAYTAGAQSQNPDITLPSRSNQVSGNVGLGRGVGGVGGVGGAGGSAGKHGRRPGRRPYARSAAQSAGKFGRRPGRRPYALSAARSAWAAELKGLRPWWSRIWCRRGCVFLCYVGAQSFGYDQDESAFIAPSYDQYQPTYEQQTFDQQEQQSYAINQYEKQEQEVAMYAGGRAAQL